MATVFGSKLGDKRGLPDRLKTKTRLHGGEAAKIGVDKQQLLFGIDNYVMDV